LTSGDDGGSSNSECNNVHSDALDWISAAISAICAESWAVSLASGAVLPADGAVTRVTVVARWVAEETAHIEAGLANEGKTSTAAVWILSARNANVGLTSGTVRWANAASNVVEVSLALGVPDGTPFLAATDIFVVVVARALAPDRVANSATVGLRLEAESAIITETVSAILPANGTDSVEASSAGRVAESSVFLLTLSAISDDLADATAIGVLPAVGAIDLSQGVAQK
jgi:hypothetical protein